MIYGFDFMRKSWQFLFLLVGSLVFFAVSTACSFSFFNNTATSVTNKYAFESIYLNTDIDFIVPSPSFSQVGEVEEDDNGVRVMTPYYSFSAGIKVGEKDAQTNVILLDDLGKIDYTPYNSKRMLQGSALQTSGFAIVDSSFSRSNHCRIGDEITLPVFEKPLVFTISGICETNTFFDGSVALALDGHQTEEISLSNYKYSAAYVCASDYDQCKSFLENEYKPYGRLKDRSEFSSDEAYYAHLNNFNNADWSKEITYMKDNYESLSVKYENIPGNALASTIISCAVFALASVGFTVFVLFLPKQRKLFGELVTKKNASIKDVSEFYKKGTLYIFALSGCVTVGSMLIICGVLDCFYRFSLVAGYFIAPLLTILASFLINLILGEAIPHRLYKK